MTWLLDDRPLRRVLVTRLRYLGDVVMATAVTGALRRGSPGLDVGFMCEEAYAPALSRHPDLARLHVLASRRRGADARARQAAGPGGGRGAVALVSELRRARYDAAVDLFFNPRSAWLTWLSGAPARLAGPAGGRRRFYTHSSRPGGNGWTVGMSELAPGGLGEHLSRLAPLVHAESGLGFVEWFEREAVPARTSLAPRPGSSRTGARALVMAPGATWPSKRWPAVHWRSLVASLVEQDGRCIRVLAAPGEREGLVRLMEGLPADRVAILPEMALEGVLDELAAAAGLVSADGGVMHAAVALGVPTIAVFGPTDPRIWFPYGHLGPYRVVATRPSCHPCDLHECPAFVCLPELGPQVVLAAAGELFAGGGTAC